MKLLRYLFATLLCIVALSSAAQAANCGGGTTCACGDTVTSNYTMPANLSCSSGHGLKVGSNVTLNCNGKTLTGANVTDTFGIYLDGSQVSTVSNCGVSSFARGFRINNGSYNTIQSSYFNFNGNFSSHVGYGGSVDGTSINNHLVSLTVVGNADEGIHLGPGSTDGLLSTSEVCGNFRESLYMLEARDWIIGYSTFGHDCYSQTSGGNSVYQKRGFHNYFLQNVFNKNSFHTTDYTVGTLLYKNTFNVSYVEDCYAPTGQCPEFTITVNP